MPASSSALKVAKSKRSGELYAQAALEDTVGKIDLICFSEGLRAQRRESLKIDVPVLVTRARCARKKTLRRSCALSSIQALEDVKVKLPQNVRIRVTLEKRERQDAD